MLGIDQQEIDHFSAKKKNNMDTVAELTWGVAISGKYSKVLTQITKK